MRPTGAFLCNKEISPKLACIKFKIVNFIFLHKSEAFLVFIEIKHKIDLDSTYLKLHLTLIKFPTLKTSTTSFTSVLEAFIYTARCGSFETKRPFLFSN